MSLLNQQQLQSVAEAIAQVESQTDAELVTVLARKADDYFYIPTLWSALIALLLPPILKLTPLWLSADELLWLQWVTFMVLALLFRIPALTLRLVPKRVRLQRAANLARRQFMENNLHHTQGENGVLIFVSEAEHYVEILADRGISDHVSQTQWQQIVDNFTKHVKAGDTLQGFLDCIHQCGDLLHQHAPYTKEKNELPNHLILINY